MLRHAFALLLVSILAACATPPTVDVSRQMLWDKFGHHSLDDLLLAWGPPTAETTLTTGARMVTYTRAVIQNGGGVDTSDYNCKASFLAPAPSYKIENVSLDGNAGACSELASGHTGTTIYSAPPQPIFFAPVRAY